MTTRYFLKSLGIMAAKLGFAILAIAALLALCSPLAHAQTVQVNQYKGMTVGAKLSNAQTNGCNAAMTCVLVIAPELSVYAEGTMPARCAKCTWLDYRSPGNNFDTLAVGTGVPAGPRFGYAHTSTATTSGYASRGMVGTCTQGANNSYCYAALFQTIAPVGRTGWNHNVGVEAKIIDHNAATTGDVYGSVVGLELATGTWAGVGHRIEFSDATNWPGQVAVGYATVDGITPVAFEAGASCTTGTCYSARFNFYGLDSGTRNASPAYVLGSPWGDLYLQAGTGGKLYMSGGAFSGDIELRPIGTGTRPSYRQYFTALNADVEVKKSVVVDSTGTFIYDGAITATAFNGNATTATTATTAANVTGIVARANGGTGADTSALPTGCVQYPCTVASVPLTTGRTTAITATTLYTPSVAGSYSMCGSITITATATSGNITAMASYNNGSATKTPNLGALVNVATLGADNNSGTGSAATCASFTAAAGQPIQYRADFSSVVGTPTYTYWFTLKREQ